MNYPAEWEHFEKIAEETNLGKDCTPIPETFNKPAFSLHEALVMLNWLKYAATIGDTTYMKITDKPVTKFVNIRRPFIETNN
jgi:hypothetical protein